MPQLLVRTLSRKINLFIAFFILLLSILAAAVLYLNMKSISEEKNGYNISIANNVFETNMNFEKASLLQTLIAVKSNPVFINAFVSGDRKKLFSVTKPFFDEIKAKHKITHFYFISPDKKCFLRVHKPEEFGDTIWRTTLQRAAERGSEYVGLEMGMNFFSLRAVTPIYDNNGNLLGYIELGREIDHFFELFKRQTNFDISLLMDDRYVRHYEADKGVKLKPHGHRVGGFTVLNSSDIKLTENIIPKIQVGGAEEKTFDDVKIGEKHYFCYSRSISDANGDIAGYLLISFDNTKIRHDIAKQYIVMLIMAVVIAVLTAVFVRYGIDREILKPLEKIRGGVVNFFDYIRGETDKLNYIEPMQNNEIGFIANSLNESMEETVNILAENKKNEVFYFQQSRVNALGEVISNIGHHWRQPLNAISIMAQDLKYAKAANELTDEYLNTMVGRITDIAKALSKTIDDLRLFYRPSSVKEEFAIEEEVQKVVNFFEVRYAELGIKIEYSFDFKHPITAYKNEFSQVLIHILKNSEEAIVANRVANGKIEIKTSEVDEWLMVSVSDNGGGIDPGALEKIFDPYFTTKHKAIDVGLGLYLSKTMVEKNMGGILRAENIENGLRIEMLLPHIGPRF